MSQDMAAGDPPRGAERAGGWAIPMMKLVGAMSLAVYALPILFVIWRLARKPLSFWMPLVVIGGAFLALHLAVTYLDPDLMFGIMLWMAGAFETPEP